VGTVFAATQSTLVINAAGVSADTATNAAGATATIVDLSAKTIELKVPNLGVDTHLAIGASADTQLPNGTFASVTDLTPGGVGGLNYAILGEWVLRDSTDKTETDAGVFAIGYQTPTASVPTSGSATYSRMGGVSGDLYVPGPTSTDPAVRLSLTGDASLTANFAANTVSGLLTNIVATAPGAAGTAWNKVAISGNITGDTFSGGTTAATAPANANALNANATGSINGGFYGPLTNEVAAVWTLSDGSKSAVGALGAATPFALGALAPATAGSTPPSTTVAGFQQATEVAPNFVLSGGATPAAGTTFALTQSALQVTTSGISADTATNGAGATATLVDLSTGTIELKLPSLGVDANVVIGASADTAVNGGFVSVADRTPGGLGSLDYAFLGEWVLKDATDQNVTHAAMFIGGFQTPLANMPTAGSARYSQQGGVSGDLFIPGAPGAFGQAEHLSLSGDVSLTATFGQGGITGTLTNIVASDPVAGTTNPWNNVSLVGSISGATFSGTTSTAATLPNSDALSVNATGSLVGGFYGPNADEVAAVWTLSDGTKSAVGGFGADTPELAYVFSPAAAATVGANTAVQTASMGGPTLNGSNSIQPVAGTAFPDLQSAILITSRETSADAAINAAGATVTVGPPTSIGGPLAVSVSIPSLGINNVALSFQGPDPFYGNSPQLFSGSLGGTKTVQIDLQNLDYVSAGIWAVLPTGDFHVASNAAVGVFGYVTPTMAMPTTGTASFTGTTIGLVGAPQGLTSLSATLTGTATLNANFGTGAFSGALSGMQATPLAGGSTELWNGVVLTGTISGSAFSGTTSVSFAPTPAGVYTLGPTATGVVNGAFYGPTAQNVGAVWSLFGGVKSAFGTFVARSGGAPSDRRLKRDIRPLGRAANGLRLYSFRYLTDPRTFVGVMAQDLLDDPRFASAVIRRPSGLLIVDYAKLGLDIADFDQMRAAGETAVAAYERKAAA
jgi:hypothetical protein